MNDDLEHVQHWVRPAMKSFFLIQNLRFKLSSKLQENVINQAYE